MIAASSRTFSFSRPRPTTGHVLTRKSASATYAAPNECSQGQKAGMHCFFGGTSCSRSDVCPPCGGSAASCTSVLVEHHVSMCPTAPSGQHPALKRWQLPATAGPAATTAATRRGYTCSQLVRSQSGRWPSGMPTVCSRPSAHGWGLTCTHEALDTCVHIFFWHCFDRVDLLFLCSLAGTAAADAAVFTFNEHSL